MPRRKRAEKREILPDGRYQNRTVTMFVNKLMQRGKKSTAERIMYSALDRIEAQTRKSPIDTFDAALRNATPTIEVKPRRVGGATYQVPVDIRAERRMALAIRWLISSSRGRSENTMEERLSGELMDAANNRGVAVKKREDTHRMADANKAFSHYRW